MRKLQSEAEGFLLELLRERAYKKGTFTLSSGKQSDFFIDCKPVILTAAGHNYVGQALYHRLGPEPDYFLAGCSAVAGVELGGCPLASAVAMYSLANQAQGPYVDALYVRKQVKGHGTDTLVEGALHWGTKAVLLEDVVTTGGSTLRAVETLRKAGVAVLGVIALVDRCEGGREAIREVLPFDALFTRADFVT